MRLGLSLVLLVASFVVLVSAEKTGTARQLKGTQTDELTVQDEERVGKWDDLLAKTKVQGLVGGGEKTAANIATAEKAAANVATAAGAGKKWQSMAKRVESLKNVDDTAAKSWGQLAKTVESGAQLKKVDTKTSTWKNAFAKLKDNPKLKDVTEAQAVKITETAAKEVAKNPSKWRHVKTFLQVTFGATLTALIVVGFNSMIS